MKMIVRTSLYIFVLVRTIVRTIKTYLNAFSCTILHNTMIIRGISISFIETEDQAIEAFQEIRDISDLPKHGDIPNLERVAYNAFRRGDYIKSLSIKLCAAKAYEFYAPDHNYPARDFTFAALAYDHSAKDGEFFNWDEFEKMCRLKVINLLGVCSALERSPREPDKCSLAKSQGIRASSWAYNTNRLRALEISDVVVGTRTKPQEELAQT
jgi:hypothetical protein